MKRLAITQLVKWKNSSNRKPLILKGVRQVGKTWLLKEFGREYYDNIAYFNFDENIALADFFIKTKDVSRILESLAIINRSPIKPEKTLIIFDEIQECNEALNTLKYFCENAPEYHVACAGSLLGIALSRPGSFPVGKVNFLDIYPMTFDEFLIASNEEDLVKYMNDINTIDEIPDYFFTRLNEKLKQYFITGGMPEAVKAWIYDKDVSLVDSVQKEIIGSYEFDFSKHTSSSDVPKLRLIWNGLSSQLAKENKKFIYSVLKEGARAREYEDAITWIINAGMAYKIHRSSKPNLPLSGYDDLSSFKLYMTDVGLLRRASFLPSSAFSEGNRLFTEFKGALTENYVLQEIVNKIEVLPRYWTSSATAEVDFVTQIGSNIFPMEVKADINVKSKSLRVYMDKYKTQIGIRYSLRNLSLDGGILNIPLFMVAQTERLLELI